MIIGRVIGSVTTSIKHPVLEGHKLLIVKPVVPGQPRADNKRGTNVKNFRLTGKSIIALDVVQAGIGDTVLILDEGNSGRMILGDSTAPVRSVIAGIVDSVSLEIRNGR